MPAEGGFIGTVATLFSAIQRIDMLNLTPHKRHGNRRAVLDLALRNIVQNSIKCERGQNYNPHESIPASRHFRVLIHDTSLSHSMI
jgi:hypothetical protein